MTTSTKQQQTNPLDELTSVLDAFKRRFPDEQTALLAIIACQGFQMQKAIGELKEAIDTLESTAFITGSEAK